MAIKAGQLIKTLELPISKANGDGRPHDDTLLIKYRPVTQAFIDKWNEQAVKEWAASQTLLALMTEQRDAETALALAEEGDEKAKAEAALDDVRKRVETHHRENPQPKYDLLTRQMAELLTDVGYVDDEDNPVPVTEEFLAGTVDRELLVEIESRIQKKLSRRSTT